MTGYDGGLQLHGDFYKGPLECISMARRLQFAEHDTLAFEVASLTMNETVVHHHVAVPASNIISTRCPCSCTGVASCYKESEWTYLPAIDNSNNSTLFDPDYPFDDDSGDETVECFGLAKRKFISIHKRTWQLFMKIFSRLESN